MLRLVDHDSLTAEPKSSVIDIVHMYSGSCVCDDVIRRVEWEQFVPWLLPLLRKRQCWQSKESLIPSSMSAKKNPDTSKIQEKEVKALC